MTDKERFDAGLALFECLFARQREDEYEIVLHELMHLVLGTACDHDDDDDSGPIAVMVPDTNTIH